MRNPRNPYNARMNALGYQTAKAPPRARNSFKRYQGGRPTTADRSQNEFASQPHQFDQQSSQYRCGTAVVRNSNFDTEVTPQKYIGSNYRYRQNVINHMNTEQ